MNIMVEIYMYLLNTLNYSTPVIRNILSHFMYQLIHNTMLCFTPFCKMTEKRMLTQQLHTVNTRSKKKLFLFYDSSKIWENKNGCTEKYRCATVLYLLAMLEHAYNIVIDQGVGSPGYGRYFF